jgi:hypothetical protein
MGHCPRRFHSAHIDVLHVITGPKREERLRADYPVIHLVRRKFFEIDGWPDQVRP